MTNEQTDEQLRITALDAAIRSSYTPGGNSMHTGAGPKINDVVERARAYYHFITESHDVADADVKSNEQPQAPDSLIIKMPQVFADAVDQVERWAKGDKRGTHVSAKSDKNFDIEAAIESVLEAMKNADKRSGGNR